MITECVGRLLASALVAEPGSPSPTGDLLSLLPAEFPQPFRFVRRLPPAMEFVFERPRVRAGVE
ncbi:hypothetical protein PSAB6_660014 [Paraburkholderia sabiae]|nr:hypothetical protein PSAB6_660014 [Paraburkholderia sabiae]